MGELVSLGRARCGSGRLRGVWRPARERTRPVLPAFRLLVVCGDPFHRVTRAVARQLEIPEVGPLNRIVRGALVPGGVFPPRVFHPWSLRRGGRVPREETALRGNLPVLDEERDLDVDASGDRRAGAQDPKIVAEQPRGGTVQLRVRELTHLTRGKPAPGRAVERFQNRGRDLDVGQILERPHPASQPVRSRG